MVVDVCRMYQGEEIFTVIARALLTTVIFCCHLLVPFCLSRAIISSSPIWSFPGLTEERRRLIKDEMGGREGQGSGQKCRASWWRSDEGPKGRLKSIVRAGDTDFISKRLWKKHIKSLVGISQILPAAICRRDIYLIAFGKPAGPKWVWCAL